jgi:hypothetical protein
VAGLLLSWDRLYILPGVFRGSLLYWEDSGLKVGATQDFDDFIPYYCISTCNTTSFKSLRQKFNKTFNLPSLL